MVSSPIHLKAGGLTNFLDPESLSMFDCAYRISTTHTRILLSRRGRPNFGRPPASKPCCARQKQRALAVLQQRSVAFSSSLLKRSSQSIDSGERLPDCLAGAAAKTKQLCLVAWHLVETCSDVSENFRGPPRLVLSRIVRWLRRRRRPGLHCRSLTPRTHSEARGCDAA